MRNDEQLTHDLGDAFRSATSDLTYTGMVPAPRRPVMVAAPVVAGVAGVAIIATVVAHASQPRHKDLARPAIGFTTHPTKPGAAHHHVTKLVTKQVSLAGYTLTYTQPSTADPLVAMVVDKVPSNAKLVPNDGPSKDYLGVDPATGYHEAYVVPSNGKVFAIGSADATDDELLAMITSDTPATVPLVGGNNG